jgi:hypothetical protein
MLFRTSARRACYSASVVRIDTLHPDWLQPGMVHLGGRKTPADSTHSQRCRCCSWRFGEDARFEKLVIQTASSIFKVRAHRRAQSSGWRRGRPALVGSNQEESEATRGAAMAATPATLRGSTPGAIGVDGSYKPITPNLNRIDPLRSVC